VNAKDLVPGTVIIFIGNDEIFPGCDLIISVNNHKLLLLRLFDDKLDPFILTEVNKSILLSHARHKNTVITYEEKVEL